ncbi:MAG: hypothetical protein ACFFAH_14340 [Promethearchaeota archaeon]
MGQFIDFDKSEKIFYNNLYLDDYKIVIKVPIGDLDYIKTSSDFKIEKFDLTNKAFILSYQ